MTLPKPSEDFTLAVICPLEIEALAMLRQLDKDKHYGSVFSDDCSFRLGGIGEHNIVITSLPGGRQGHSSATVAGQQTKAKFPNIQCILLVGVAGGVPSNKNDIRLGDVVVSFPTGKYGGVVQYDFGKEEEEFKRNGQTNSVPQKLLAYLDSIKLTHGLSEETPKYIRYLDAQIAAGQLAKPDSRSDRLFHAAYFHPVGPDCTDCDGKQVQLRSARNQPRVHYGLIASGNRVMKNGQQRDQCNQDHGGNVLAYEMEAAGLMNFTPCLVIRGISDYSDSHKPSGKIWHAFAAAAAASYAREFIEEVPAETVQTALRQETVEREQHWTVPFGRNKDFIGREPELQYLLATLDPKHEDDCQRVAISGLGGIGKTQIALEAAFRIKESIDCSVFWVPAVDAVSFERAYREIGNIFSIPGTNDDKADIKSLVKGFLSSKDIGNWLMIIDNADDLELLFNRSSNTDEDFRSLPLVDYLPFSYRGSILFTTRNSKVAVKYTGTDFVTVKDMSEDESRELLEISLVDKSLTRDKEVVSKLLDILCNLPLAIKQAAAFLNENSMSISEYVEIYENSNEDLIELLSESFEDKGRYQSTKNPVASTWLISFQNIERIDELAAKYLYFMSCVAQQDIPRSLLPPASKLRESKAIGTLKAYSFITERTGYGSYNIHRLVQVAARNWLKKENSLSSWSLKTLNRLAEVFPVFKHGKKDECTLLLPHTQYVLESQRLSKDSGDSLRKLLFNVGEYFLQTGNYYEAEKMFQRTLELRKKVFGIRHPDTLHGLNSLANVKFRQGNIKEAESIHRQTMGLREKVLGPQHPDTLVSMNHLANVFNMQGSYQEAESMHQRTLWLREKVLGPEHPDTLMSMNNFAAVLERQGKYNEAGNIHRQTIDLREKVLGSEHPDTLGSMDNLANVLNRLGKHEEAESIHRRTLGLRKKVLGVEHPDTLMSMNNLAAVIDEQERYKEAEIIYWPTIKLREKVLGPEHPDTLISISNLAYVLDRQGNFEDAESMYRQMIGSREKVLGQEHPDTLESIKNLGLVLASQGKYEEAETIYRQTLELKTKVLGPEHPSTLDSMSNLASILRHQGKYEESETKHRQTLTEKVLGPEHPSTLDSINNLTLLLNMNRSSIGDSAANNGEIIREEDKIGFSTIP